MCVSASQSEPLLGALSSEPEARSDDKHWQAAWISGIEWRRVVLASMSGTASAAGEGVAGVGVGAGLHDPERGLLWGNLPMRKELATSQLGRRPRKTLHNRPSPPCRDWRIHHRGLAVRNFRLLKELLRGIQGHDRG